jgi:hypothetical protein
MNRERALKVVLVVVGLLFTAGVYPVVRKNLVQSANAPGSVQRAQDFFRLGSLLKGLCEAEWTCSRSI